MSAQHTFGEWVLLRTDTGGNRYWKQYDIRAGDLLIAELSATNTHTPAEHNAQLIVSAPKLLAMCGMALDILLADGYDETSHPVMQLRAVINEAAQS